MAAAEPHTAHEIDLSELEFEPDEGPEIARRVDRIRALVEAHGRVRVDHCPQMLAHTLYKIGALRDGRIALVDAREEEPYG